MSLEHFAKKGLRRVWFHKGLVGIVWAVAGCVIVFPSGCSERVKQPDVVKVSGIVTYKGAPLPKAWVTFIPAESSGSSLVASGQTNDTGGFQLMTFRENDGCTLGNKVVLITAFEGGGQGDSIQQSESDQIIEPGMPGYKEPKSLIPKRYADPTTSGLTATVEAGKANTFEFSLTDEK